MLTAKGMNSSDLRQRNRGLVLKLVAMQEKASRISITRETCLSKMTVTTIVTELLKEQYLIQTSSQKSSGAGRNPVLLDISPGAPVILGLYISRSYIEAALSNLKGSLLWRRSIPLKQESASTLKDKLTGLANAAMHSAKGRLLAINFLTLFEDGLYYKLGDHANKMAQEIAEALKEEGASSILVLPIEKMLK